MENNNCNPLDSQVRIRFSPEEEKECFVEIRSNLIKLLYLIEDEQAGKGSAELWLYGFLVDLSSTNTLCDNKLTRVIVKIHALADNKNQYKTMTHAQIKRQIMESKGILDSLIGDKPVRKNK